MEKLLKKTRLVKQILQEVPVTRRDDSYLLLEYYGRKSVDINASFKQLVLTNQLKDIMSVIRTRQKLQEQFVDLRHEETYNARHHKKETFVNYAVNVNFDVINRLED